MRCITLLVILAVPTLASADPHHGRVEVTSRTQLGGRGARLRAATVAHIQRYVEGHARYRRAFPEDRHDAMAEAITEGLAQLEAMPRLGGRALKQSLDASAERGLTRALRAANTAPARGGMGARHLPLDGVPPHKLAIAAVETDGGESLTFERMVASLPDKRAARLLTRIFVDDMDQLQAAKALGIEPQQASAMVRSALAQIGHAIDHNAAWRNDGVVDRVGEGHLLRAGRLLDERVASGALAAGERDRVIAIASPLADRDGAARASPPGRRSLSHNAKLNQQASFYAVGKLVELIGRTAREQRLSVDAAAMWGKLRQIEAAQDADASERLLPDVDRFVAESKRRRGDKSNASRPKRAQDAQLLAVWEAAFPDLSQRKLSQLLGAHYQRFADPNQARRLHRSFEPAILAPIKRRYPGRNRRAANDLAKLIDLTIAAAPPATTISEMQSVVDRLYRLYGAEPAAEPVAWRLKARGLKNAQIQAGRVADLLVEYAARAKPGDGHERILSEVGRSYPAVLRNWQHLEAAWRANPTAYPQLEPLWHKRRIRLREMAEIPRTEARYHGRWSIKRALPPAEQAALADAEQLLESVATAKGDHALTPTAQGVADLFEQATASTDVAR